MDPLDHLIAQEERDLFTGAVRQLPETERLIFRMIDIESFSEREVSHCIAMPAAKVRRALTRAREMLKKRLA